MSQTPDIWFSTLGMIVLDELQLPAKESVTDIVGGSGTYGKLVHVPLNLEGSASATRYHSASSMIGWMIRIG